MSLTTKVFVPLAIIIAAGFIASRIACGCSPKWKAYLAAMRGELRDIDQMQQDSLAHNRVFSADPAAVRAILWTGVVLDTIAAADSSGWWAVVSHQETRHRCGIKRGSVSLPREFPRQEDGVPGCIAR